MCFACCHEPCHVCSVNFTCPRPIWVQFEVVSVSSEENTIRSIPSLRSFPNVAFETVPMFVWLRTAFCCPFSENRRILSEHKVKCVVITEWDVYLWFDGLCFDFIRLPWMTGPPGNLTDVLRVLASHRPAHKQTNKQTHPLRQARLLTNLPPAFSQIAPPT